MQQNRYVTERLKRAQMSSVFGVKAKSVEAG